MSGRHQVQEVVLEKYTRLGMRGYTLGSVEFWLLAVLFLVSKLGWRWCTQSLLCNRSQVLKTAILSEFKFILNRKSIFPFEDMDFTLVPHVWISWWTDRGDVLDLQFSTSTFLVRFEFNRFIFRFKDITPNLFYSWRPLCYSSHLNFCWDRLIDWILKNRDLIRR